MQRCWLQQVNTRPLFGELENAIAEMLSRDEVCRLVQLNAPYLLMNEKNGIGGCNDLLAKMASTSNNEIREELEDLEMLAPACQEVQIQGFLSNACTSNV